MYREVALEKLFKEYFINFLELPSDKIFGSGKLKAAKVSDLCSTNCDWVRYIKPYCFYSH